MMSVVPRAAGFDENTRFLAYSSFLKFPDYKKPRPHRGWIRGAVLLGGWGREGFRRQRATTAAVTDGSFAEVLAVEGDNGCMTSTARRSQRKSIV